jgi:hypothetical protein
MRTLFLIAATLITTACTPPSFQESEFMQRVSGLCGKAFEGRVTSDDAVDDAWRAQRIVMHVRDCSTDEVRIPLHVGNDHSRVWVIHREANRLALHHEHRHEDGSFDALTGYGGMQADRFSHSRMTFPADQATKDLFDQSGIPQSKENVWAIEVRPSDNLFAYELDRPGRFFRVEFDTASPIDLPPPPWGEE